MGFISSGHTAENPPDHQHPLVQGWELQLSQEDFLLPLPSWAALTLTSPALQHFAAPPPPSQLSTPSLLPFPKSLTSQDKWQLLPAHPSQLPGPSISQRSPVLPWPHVLAEGRGPLIRGPSAACHILAALSAGDRAVAGPGQVREEASSTDSSRLAKAV